MPDRFDKFSEGARRSLTLAQEEAQRFNLNYIGTEHLLLGILRVENDMAAQVLTTLGINLDDARGAVEKIVGRGDRAVLGRIGLTPQTKKVIALAVDEARRWYHGYIGTEHLLSGLIADKEAIAVGILESLGISRDRVREELSRLLASIPPSVSASSLTHGAVDDLGEAERLLALAAVAATQSEQADLAGELAKMWARIQVILYELNAGGSSAAET